MTLPDLPITDVLEQLLKLLSSKANTVVVAPPGAGKTTMVPLALLGVEWTRGKKIIVLEPRRLAARSAAKRMAFLLGEKVGETVGYRVRLESKISARTRIEVVTEGVFSRIIQDDPELTGIAAVLFDEFHERNLDSDFALALAMDVQQALREDLRILVMSATIDGAQIADLINGRVVRSEGRSFPVEVVYHDRPVNIPLEQFVAKEIQRALSEHTGSVLVFLPGQGEIKRVAKYLEDWLSGSKFSNIDIAPLYGAMDSSNQDLAIQAAAAGRRKVVLATSIAETSLTIDGITIVIDSGLARLPRFEPANGLTRLETVRASVASVDQRAGRAGRVAPGLAIRLWRREQTASLPKQTPPEILSADLSQLMLDLAAWGVDRPEKLIWLDLPPLPAINEAQSLLRNLGAFDQKNRLTHHGKSLRKLSMPPRSANMLVQTTHFGSQYDAALLSVVLGERSLGGNSINLEERCEKAAHEKSQRAKAARNLAHKLEARLNLMNRQEKNFSQDDKLSTGTLLSFAWPERVAQRTGQSASGAIRYRLANGSGAELEPEHELSRAPWLVIADIAGKAGAARILSAAPITLKEVENFHFDNITEKKEVLFDPATGKVKATESRQLGSLELSKVTISRPESALVEQALLDGVAKYGLHLLQWSGEANSLRRRLQFLHGINADQWPGVSDKELLARIDGWLTPILAGKSSLNEISPALLDTGLKLLVPWSQHEDLDRLAPLTHKLPAGENIKLCYRENEVILSVRAQKLFGVTNHPSVMDGKHPVQVEILSPAGRPVQITRDLPGFWQGSWKEVKAEMKSRYPKHYWPDNPASAASIRLPKHRGSAKK